MTKQETFDTCCDHMRRQGGPGGHDGDSYYRCSVVIDGVSVELRDIVGCLIPDDRYHPSLEGVGVGELSLKSKVERREQLALLSHAIEGHDRQLLGYLQYAHECAYDGPAASDDRLFMADLDRRLIDIAQLFELDYRSILV
jgi:hypothetical protein